MYDLDVTYNAYGFYIKNQNNQAKYIVSKILKYFRSKINNNIHISWKLCI